VPLGMKVNRRASRFAHDVNHCISKSLVQKALSLQRALALENLTNIRERSNDEFYAQVLRR